MENYLGKHITWIWKKKIKPFEMDYSWFYITINLYHALIIGFPGDWPAGYTRKNPGPCGNFAKHLPCRVRTLDWFLKRTRQTPEMHLRDLFAIGQRYVTFQSPGWTWMWTTLPPFVWYFVEVFSVCCMFVLHHAVAQSLGRGKRTMKVCNKPIDILKFSLTLTQ